MNVPSLVRKGHDLAVQLLGRLEFVPALLTRLIVGFAFFDSGSGKLANMENTVSFFSDLGIPFPELNAAFVSRLEYYGGMLILAGVATRIVAALLSSTMIVALLTADRDTFLNAFFRKAAEDGSAGIGLSDVAPFVLLAFLSWLVIRGAGALSGDFILAKVLRGREPKADEPKAA